MSKQNVNRCTFCGRPKSETELLVEGQDAFICNYCIEQAHQILVESSIPQSSSTPKGKIEFNYKPSDIKNFLDQYVIGQ